MSLTALPTAPNTLRPTTFASEMDAFLAALIVYQTEMNAAATAYGVMMRGTSTTSLTVGTGAQSLTTQTGLALMPGSAIIIAHTATPSNRMMCTVTSYDAGTGALVVNADSVGGSGTHTAWSISPGTNVSFDSQTFTDLRLSGKFTEAIHALSGTSPALDPANGTIQTWTLSANSNPSDSLSDGTGILLMVNDGTAHTVTWPTMTWVGGAAPTLPLTGYCCIELWKVASTLYGVWAGNVA